MDLVYLEGYILTRFASAISGLTKSIISNNPTSIQLMVAIDYLCYDYAVISRLGLDINEPISASFNQVIHKKLEMETLPEQYTQLLSIIKIANMSSCCII